LREVSRFFLTVIFRFIVFLSVGVVSLYIYKRENLLARVFERNIATKTAIFARKAQGDGSHRQNEVLLKSLRLCKLNKIIVHCFALKQVFLI